MGMNPFRHGSVLHTEISDNVLANGTVARISSGLFGVREVNVRRNVFTNFVNDFSSPHGLLWLDLTGVGGAQGVLVQGNVFTRDPESPSVPNTHAVQLDGEVGANVVFDMNYIRNMNDQFIGTLGSQNLHHNRP